MSTYEGQWLTLFVIIGAAVGLVAYDFWIIWKCGSDASISRVLAGIISKFPLLFTWLMLGLGLLIGHCFLPAGQR